MALFKKILLVKPPECSLLNFGTFSLGVLAAAVRHLADAEILDATNLTLEETITRIIALKPDLIGLTAMGIPSVEPVQQFVKRLKEEKIECSIVVGGHGATMLPEPILEAGADMVVFGEGELTFAEIVSEGLKPGTPGTIMKVDGSTRKGQTRPLIWPMDGLEFPARDLMPPPPTGIYLMETSRGCPHKCLFCETTRFYGTRWRPFSPERVVMEIKKLIDEYDAWIIHIADDNFTASSARVKKICELLRGETLPAFFMVSARADDLIADPELLPLLAEARFLRISVGIDTLDPQVAKEVDKPISLEIYKEAFKRMRDLGIFSIGSLIVGLPGETEEARRRGVEYAVEAAPDSAYFLPFLPQPGLALPKNKNYIGYNSDPVDIEDSRKYSAEFFYHPNIQANLKKLSESDEIQGLLARTALTRKGQPTSSDL